MQQHQIPQNVTKYEFGLIGGVTPRQFIEAATGIVIALIIQYVFKFIPSYIRSPIAITIAISGIALTFVKYEERTLDTWLVNFIKSIYNPTLYTWRRKAQIPAFFNFIPTSPKLHKSTKSSNSNHLQKYIKTTQTSKATLSENQQQRVDNINQMFQGGNPQTQTNPQPPSPTKQSLQSEQKEDEKPQPTSQIVYNSQTQPNTIPQSKNQMLQSIPSNPKPQPRPQTIVKAPSIAPALKVKSIYKDQKSKSIKPEFASDIEVPITPQSPNIITGITIDNREKLIANVIVEIADKNNLPVRAVKSNNLGQFFIASPLKNGTYLIKAQHPNYIFDNIDVEAEGEILPPIKIIGTPENQHA